MTVFDAGKHSRDRGIETRKKIKDWFSRNPLLTAKQCASDLGVTEATVSRHVQILKAEALKDRSKNNG